LVLLASRHGADPVAQSMSPTSLHRRAYDVVVVVAHASLETGGGAGRLDPADEPSLGEGAENVVDGLGRDRPES